MSLPRRRRARRCRDAELPANSTESVSFLAYRQTIARLEIGLGSAVSVLLFLCVVLIAVGFIKGFKVDLSQARGEK